MEKTNTNVAIKRKGLSDGQNGTCGSDSSDNIADSKVCLGDDVISSFPQKGDKHVNVLSSQSMSDCPVLLVRRSDTTGKGKFTDVTETKTPCLKKRRKTLMDSSSSSEFSSDDEDDGDAFSAAEFFRSPIPFKALTYSESSDSDDYNLACDRDNLDSDSQW